MNRLAGKVALVTGGNSGIGLATAKLFHVEGATVFISARRLPELEAAAGEIGDRAIALQGDISTLSDLDRIFDAIHKRSGQLDILFANAGLGEFVPLGRITEVTSTEHSTSTSKGQFLRCRRHFP